jgi:hypothetical protein
MAPSGHAKTTRTVSWRGGSVLAGSMMWAALGGGRPPWPRLGHGLSSFPDKGTYRGSPVRVKALAARDVRASTSRAVSCLQKRWRRVHAGRATCCLYRSNVLSVPSAAFTVWAVRSWIRRSPVRVKLGPHDPCGLRSWFLVLPIPATDETPKLGVSDDPINWVEIFSRRLLLR